jgi:GNAT superfamily N-acetyltransferase
MVLVDICDAQGRVCEPQWLARAEAVHRQLRPALADYDAAMRRIFGGGARMILAVQNSDVLGVAVYRVSENTAYGRNCYVDDLVTHEASRSTGVGHALLDRIEQIARAQQCLALHLDSGTQRKSAHRFYLRERFEIASFHFSKSL